MASNNILWIGRFSLSILKYNRLFLLEGTHNDRLIQLWDKSRADQMLKHVVKGTVQTPLKHWLT